MIDVILCISGLYLKNNCTFTVASVSWQTAMFHTTVPNSTILVNIPTVSTRSTSVLHALRCKSTVTWRQQEADGRFVSTVQLHNVHLLNL